MRYIALFLTLFLIFSCSAALADTGFDACMEDFMASADENGKPQILYIGTSKISMNMRSEPDTESASLGCSTKGFHPDLRLRPGLAVLLER